MQNTLNDADHESAEKEMPMDLTYYPHAAFSCAFFLAVNKYVAPHLSTHFFPNYKHLSSAKQRDWNTRVSSSIHAALVSTACLYVFMHEQAIHDDPVWADSQTVKYNCAIVVGYMISDSVIMVVHYRDLGELFYVFHHGASIYAYYYVMTYGALPWFANFRLIAEFSTPLVNQRWFLDTMSYPKDSPVVILNGIAMAMIFFIVRIASMPPYWYKVYSIYGSDTCARLGSMWYVLISTCALLDIINLYWFSKIVKGANKLLHTTVLKRTNLQKRQ